MKLSLIFLFIAVGFISSAQSIDFKYSEPFDEPGGWDTKLIQCTNGNTLLLAFTNKQGINTKIFDSAGNLKEASELTSELWKEDIGKSAVAGIFEIEGNVVVFLEQVVDWHPTLYRILISPETGKMVGQGKIAELPEAYKSISSRFAMPEGTDSPRGFFVEKDPNSENYAVLAFDGFSSQMARRIELIVFDEKHQQVSRGYYDSPQNRYKCIWYMGMVVRGKEEVALITYGYNSKDKSSDDSHVIFSTMRNGKFEHRQLDLALDITGQGSAFTFNAGMGLYQWACVSRGHKDAHPAAVVSSAPYSVVLVGIDPQRMDVKYAKALDYQPLSQYAQSRYNLKNEFLGPPMDVQLYPDGSSAVIMEERSFGSPHDQLTKNIFGNIGLMEYKPDGSPAHGCVVRNLQHSRRKYPWLSHPARRKGQSSIILHMKGSGYGSDQGFYSFSFLNLSSGKFLFFNEHPGNFEAGPTGELKPLVDVSDANTVCYRVVGDQLSKFYLFGKPGETFVNRYALMTSGTYSAVTGKYAILILEEKEKKQSGRIAWAHLQ